MMVTSSPTQARGAWARWEPLTGIAFVVLFLAGLFAVNVPNDDASDSEWHNYYADHGHQVATTISGFLIVLAALSLLAFLTTLWTRIAAMRRPDAISPLPLLAAAVAASCIAVGAIAQAIITGAMIFGTLKEPGADALRFAIEMSYPMIAVGGMLATSLSVVVLSAQAHAAGLFGRAMFVFGLVVAVLLLASVFFFPMAGLAIWVIVAVIILMRRSTAVSSAPAPVPLAGPA